MQVQQREIGYFLRLERGEKVLESLLKLIHLHQIQSGTVISGVGAVRNARLGFYHLSRKAYEEKLVAAECELVNLSGNISWLKDKPVVHCHVTLGTDNFQALAGHLFDAEVAITAEILVEVSAKRMERAFDETMGLNLLSL